MQSLEAFNFRQWIDANRAHLKPPVGNKRVFQDGDFIIMVVGGPNARKDYHVDPGQEFFYQLEGGIVLKTMQDGRAVDVPIRAGEVLDERGRFARPDEHQCREFERRGPAFGFGEQGLQIRRRQFSPEAASVELSGFRGVKLQLLGS